jgi:hypothetical protein
MNKVKGHERVSGLQDVPERLQFHCPACDHVADATLRYDEFSGRRRWKIGSRTTRCPGKAECLAGIATALGCRGDQLLSDPGTFLEPLRLSQRLRRPTPAEPLPTEDGVAEWQNERRESAEATERLYAMGFRDETLDRFQIGYGSFHSRPLAFMQPVRDEDGELCQLIESYWPEPWFNLATGEEHKSRVLAGRGTALYPMEVLTPRTSRPLAVLGITAGRWKAPLMIQAQFDAVTSITGTNWKPEWTRYLEGRAVAVLYDVNEEDLARQRAAEFRSAGVDAWAVPLSHDGMRGKQGVDDYLRARSSKRLRQLIRRERRVA